MPDAIGGGAQEQTVGYRYYMGLHMVICHGPVDEVTQIIAGEREAWSGSVTSTQRITIDAGDLFGGDEREGGIAGDVDVEFGDVTQGANDYLQGQLGIVPAYRGVLAFVFRQAYMVANNPYIKPFQFIVRRVPRGWNEAEALVGDGANPAHVIREILTNVDWGMGYPPSSVDDASFLAASAQLVSENFGLSLIWTQQQELRQLIQDVLDHVSGVMTVSPTTGRFQIKLIRDDYVVGDLPIIDESIVTELEKYERAGWGETINELSVIYTRRETFADTRITVQDLGNVQIQGPVADTRRYPGITDDDLAARVAMRDLTSLSRPLARVTLRVNREAWSLLPGDVFRFQWSELGIVELVMRIVTIDTGTLEDGSIRVEAIEDTWAFKDNAYTRPEPIGWIDPVGDPEDTDPRLPVEASYWDLAQRLPQQALDNLDDFSCYLGTLGGRPQGIALVYDLYTIFQGTGFDETEHARGAADFAPHAVINEALVPELISQVTVSQAVDLDLVRTNRYAIIESELPGFRSSETVLVTAIDTVARTMTIERGLIDTVPAVHPAGARIWWAENYQGLDGIEYSWFENVQVKYRTRTTAGRADFATSPIEVIGFRGRKHRPLAPGNVRINGEPYPTGFSATLNVTWSHRDRLSQTDTYPRQSDGDIGPEPGTTYNLRIYGETGTLQRTYTGLTGTSQDYTTADDINDNGLGRASTQLTIELESERETLQSWQAHRITVVRDEAAGWGLQWGLNWGGPPP